jgi:hypothetical protein
MGNKLKWKTHLEHINIPGSGWLLLTSALNSAISPVVAAAFYRVSTRQAAILNRNVSSILGISLL